MTTYIIPGFTRSTGTTLYESFITIVMEDSDLPFTWESTGETFVSGVDYSNVDVSNAVSMTLEFYDASAGHYQTYMMDETFFAQSNAVIFDVSSELGLSTMMWFDIMNAPPFLLAGTYIDHYREMLNYFPSEFDPDPLVVYYDTPAGAFAEGNEFTVSDFEYAIVTEDDFILGTIYADEFSLGVGDDTIEARGGDDIIYGGEGNDSINGGNGYDALYGDTGDDKIKGGADSDFIFGGEGSDRLNGGTGEDVVYGGDGRDFIYGGNELDYLFGGEGNDRIIGGSGNDILSGDGGRDVLRGDDGADVFLIRETSGLSRILDFEENQDTLHIDAGVDFNDINIRENSTGVIITFGENRIVLRGLSESDISEGDFDFSPTFYG